MSQVVENFHKTWKKVSSGKDVTDQMNEALEQEKKGCEREKGQTGEGFEPETFGTKS